VNRSAPRRFIGRGLARIRRHDDLIVFLDAMPRTQERNFQHLMLFFQEDGSISTTGADEWLTMNFS
jgi:hypothetical protein